MNWDHKLEPDIDERAEQLYEEFYDLTDEEVIEEMRRLDKIKTNDDGSEIIGNVDKMRDYLIDYYYWEEE